MCLFHSFIFQLKPGGILRRDAELLIIRFVAQTLLLALMN